MYLHDALFQDAFSSLAVKLLSSPRVQLTMVLLFLFILPVPLAFLLFLLPSWLDSALASPLIARHFLQPFFFFVTLITPLREALAV